MIGETILVVLLIALIFVILFDAPRRDGIRGLTGHRGLPGPDGPEGARGIQGSMIRGPRGVQGSSPSFGTQGSQGLVGRVGIQGLRGGQGPIGVESGSQGIQGGQGADGNTGPLGSQGDSGLQGYQGPMGLMQTLPPIGPVGFQGSQGPVSTTDFTSLYATTLQTVAICSTLDDSRILIWESNPTSSGIVWDGNQNLTLSRTGTYNSQYTVNGVTGPYAALRVERSIDTGGSWFTIQGTQGFDIDAYPRVHNEQDFQATAGDMLRLSNNAVIPLVTLGTELNTGSTAASFPAGTTFVSLTATVPISIPGSGVFVSLSVSNTSVSVGVGTVTDSQGNVLFYIEGQFPTPSLGQFTFTTTAGQPLTADAAYSVTAGFTITNGGALDVIMLVQEFPPATSYTSTTTSNSDVNVGELGNTLNYVGVGSQIGIYTTLTNLAGNTATPGTTNDFPFTFNVQDSAGASLSAALGLGSVNQQGVSELNYYTVFTQQADAGVSVYLFSLPVPVLDLYCDGFANASWAVKILSP